VQFAAALNSRDKLAIDHGFPEIGLFVPGSDIAGVVVEIGSGVSGRAIGRSPPAIWIVNAIKHSQEGSPLTNGRRHLRGGADEPCPNAGACSTRR
jgi:hypothetical protein